MKLYAYKTGNRHNQYLIFTSKAAFLRWGRAATRLTDGELLAEFIELKKSKEFYSLFPELDAERS